VFYAFAVTVPPNTPEASAIWVRAPVCHGVIHRVEIEFEKWCANLLHVRIYRFEYQIWPSGPAQAFASDGETLSWNDYFEMFESPYSLKIAAWNTDDTFEWTARVRFGIIPRDIAAHLYGKRGTGDAARLRESFNLPPEAP